LLFGQLVQLHFTLTYHLLLWVCEWLFLPKN